MPELRHVLGDTALPHLEVVLHVQIEVAAKPAQLRFEYGGHRNLEEALTVPQDLNIIAESHHEMVLLLLDENAASFVRRRNRIPVQSDPILLTQIDPSLSVLDANPLRQRRTPVRTAEIVRNSNRKRVVLAIRRQLVLSQSPKREDFTIERFVVRISESPAHSFFFLTLRTAISFRVHQMSSVWTRLRHIASCPRATGHSVVAFARTTRIKTPRLTVLVDVSIDDTLRGPLEGLRNHAFVAATIRPFLLHICSAIEDGTTLPDADGSLIDAVALGASIDLLVVALLVHLFS